MSLWGFFIHFSAPNCVASVISSAIRIVRIGVNQHTPLLRNMCQSAYLLKYNIASLLEAY